MTGAGRRRPGRWASLAAVAALAGTLGACNAAGPPATISAGAVFPDVGGLVVGAQVQMAQVPVGRVAAISLDGDRARVTMALDRSARIPRNVTAELDWTTILGERYVELAPPRHPGAPLADGGTIARTEVVPDVEDLVGAGAQVFGSVSTSELAQIVAAGGEGFEGQAASLRQLLDDLSAVTAGYADHTSQIQTVITSLDQLGSSLAPDAASDAGALTTLSQTVTELARESGQFEDTLQALDSLSVQGGSLLSTYFPQITDQLQALRAVSGQLAAHQQDLAGLLEYLPLHDATTQSATRNDYIQVLENIIVCGIPGGGSTTAAPAFTCAGHGSGG
jgi:phospholipid/cholesterol/gamma-HCH transport system substrate-binding protein